MGMLTLLVPVGSLGEESAIQLAEDQGHHLRVRRTQPNETVRLIDGAGMEAEGSILQDGDGYLAFPTKAQRVPPSPSLTLGVGAGDRERFGWLVEKAAELGVTEVIPIETALSASVATRVRARHVERLGKRAREALKQCGGTWAMTVAEPISLDHFASREWDGPRWLAAPRGEPLPRSLTFSDPVAVAIGPEGGFTEPEVTILTGAGFQPVTLGSGTLRFETAGLAAATAVAVLRSFSQE